MHKNYEIIASSPPDRERLVIELWFGGTQFGELRPEAVGEEPIMEIYPRRDGKPWELNFSTL